MSLKRVTSQDVADAVGVSRTTVSLVLNDVTGIQISEDTRQKVIAAARELGYVPDAAARALASRRAQIIGLVLTRSPHHIASDAFLTQILDGLLEVIHYHGLRLLIDILEPEHQEQAYHELVRAKHIDGLILSGPRFDDQALNSLQSEGFPIVLMGQLPGSSFCSVDVDNRAAARQAVEHLIGHGHTRIACLTNAELSYTAAAHRLQGYRDALEFAGLAYDPNLVRCGDFSLRSGYLQMQALLEAEPDFSAAFVASDEVAIGAMAAVRQHGMRIPEDLALIGFDDIPMAYYLDPPLTTVHLPAADLARQASVMLIGILQGQQPVRKHQLLDTHLVMRASCGGHQSAQ